MAIEQFKTDEVILSNINQDTIPKQIVMQGEKDGRSLTVQVRNGGIVEPQAGLNLNLGWKHRTAKDKNGDLIQGLDAFQAIDRENGIFRIEYASSMAQPGIIDAEIQFVTSTSVTKSQPFIITVKPSTVDENAVESESSFTVLQEALTRVSQYDGKIEGLEINKADRNQVNELEVSKADREQLDKVENMVSKMPTATPKETFLNLGALQSKYPLGNASAMLVLESDGETGYVYLWDGSSWKKGALYQEKGIGEKQVQTKNLDISSVSQENIAEEFANIYDYKKGQDGYVASLSGGGLIANANWSVSEYIPASQGDVFRAKKANFVVAAAFDENYKIFWVFDTMTGDLIEREFVAPAGTAFIVFNVLRTNTREFVATKNRQLPLDYIPAEKKKLNWLEVDNKNIKEKSIESRHLTGEIIHPGNIAGKSNYVAGSANRFDKNKLIDGSYATLNGFVTSANWVRTDYIPISESDVIRVNEPSYLYAVTYDANSKALRSFEAAGNGAAEVYFMADEKFIVLNVIRSKIDSYMYTINSPLPNEYEEYQKEKTELDWLSLQLKNVSFWSNKTCQWFGDSISWQDGKPYPNSTEIAKGFQTILNDNLDFKEIENLAISGRPIADGTVNGPGIVSVILEKYKKCDLVVVSGGTNDFKLNVPLGEIKKVKSVFDRNTFCGALQAGIEQVLSNESEQQFLFMTPLQRDNAGYDIYSTNTAGQKLIDYVNTIKDVCQLYSIPCWDGYSVSGVNLINLSDLTLDGLHLNDEGYKKCSRTLVPFVNSIKV
nr:MAG TPA: GDSL like Lipase Acylhydrolase [Caudoviricetes sp.]